MTRVLILLVVGGVSAGLALAAWEFLLARRIPRDLSHVGIGVSLGLGTFVAGAVTGTLRWNDGVMLGAVLMGSALASVMAAWVLRALRQWNRGADRA